MPYYEPEHYSGECLRCSIIKTLPLVVEKRSFSENNTFSEEFVALNEENRLLCVRSIYDKPSMYGMNEETSPCLRIDPV